MQRVVKNNLICDWKHVNKGTTQGRMSSPYLLSIFPNDLEISMGGKLSVLNMLMTEQLLFLCLRTMTQQLNLLIVFRMV